MKARVRPRRTFGHPKWHSGSNWTTDRTGGAERHNKRKGGSKSISGNRIGYTSLHLVEGWAEGRKHNRSACSGRRQEWTGSQTKRKKVKGGDVVLRRPA